VKIGRPPGLLRGTDLTKHHVVQSAAHLPFILAGRCHAGDSAVGLVADDLVLHGKGVSPLGLAQEPVVLNRIGAGEGHLKRIYDVNQGLDFGGPGCVVELGDSTFRRRALSLRQGVGLLLADVELLIGPECDGENYAKR
jgi:hypothetical protein